MTRRPWVVIVAALVMSQLARAQEASPAPPESSPDAARLDPLTERQAVVRDRLLRLEEKMFELSKALEKAEPQNAARLREALTASRSRELRQKFDAIIELLGRTRYSDALDSQRAVAEDLQQLLKMLLEDANRLDDRKKEIERLEAFRKALEKIIEEQRAEKARAEAAIAEAERAAALDAAAAKARALLERQQAATARTGQGAASEGLPAEQGKIREDTGALGKDVERMSGKPADEATPTSDNAPKASDPGSESEEGSKASGSDAAAKAAEKLRGAEKEMKSAEQRLGEGSDEAARNNQRAAEEELRKAAEELGQEAKKIRNKLKLDEQAEEQEKTADKTRDLGRQMGGSEGGSENPPENPNGENRSDGRTPPEGGRQGGEGDAPQEPRDPQDPDHAPTPGREEIEGAVPYQDEAEKKLREQDPEEAAKKQEEAIKKLEQAQQELEDVLEQLRREQQEEMLAALEARFRAMLGQQLEVNRGTNRLAEVGREAWKRSDQLELAELAEKQRWVGTEAGRALRILEEEGSTVVFPQVVEQVRDDAQDAGERLAAADVGRQVQLTQREIETALRELIDAVKKMQEENERRDREGEGGGQSGNEPLLPGSAELKLLRSCQLRVNAWTQEIETDRVRPDVAVQDIESRVKKLDQRQKHVDKMARAMRDSLNRAQ